MRKRDRREMGEGAGQQEPGCGGQAGKAAGGSEAQSRTAKESTMEKTGWPRWRLGNLRNQVRKCKCRTQRQTERQTKDE